MTQLTIDETVSALRPFVRCPLFGHSEVYANPLRRRIDCADEQCKNSEHTKYVTCDHPSHRAAELVAAFDGENAKGAEGDG